MAINHLLPSPENRWLCFYHAACFDGLIAAWLVRKHAGARYVGFAPIAYTDNTRFDAETLAGVETVAFVDYAPSGQMVQQVRALGKKVVVIDHHPASEALAAYVDEGFELLYDSLKSGTSLVWHLFFPDEKVPDFIRLVEEIDLNIIPQQQQGAYFEAAAFMDLHRADDTPGQADPWLSEALHLPLAELARRGAQHRAALLGQIREAIKHPSHMVIKGQPIPLVQADIYPLGHEFFPALMQQESSNMAAAWHLCTGYVRLNLRAGPGRSIVPVRDFLLEAYGATGGGHPHASVVRFSPEAWGRFYNDCVRSV